MSTALQAAIDELLNTKTFSLDALEGIQALKKKAAELEAGIESAKKNAERLEPIASRVKDVEAQLAATSVQAAKDRDALAAAQTKEAVAAARSAVYQECFGLVFRNTEFRRTMSGQAPAGFNNSPTGSYGSLNTSVSEEVTETIK